MKLLFWRRLGAGWIDLFLVYAAVSAALVVCTLCRLRVTLEPLLVATAAVYGAVFLSLRGRTPGKALLNLVVEPASGGRATATQMLVRELFGKWLLSVVLPVEAVRSWLKDAWVPTVFDALVLGVVLLLALLFSLVARRPWYDWIAGTVVRQVPAPAWPAKRAAVFLLVAASIGLGSKAVEYASRGYVPSHLALHQNMRSAKPYVQFLDQARSTPREYVIGLFERYDVVVLCERFHPEASQWDFIFDVVRDPRFVNRVGHVFTEYGNSAMQRELDQFMAADGLLPAQVHEGVVHLMRNFSVWPIWPNLNFHTYLTRLYDLNQSLPPAKRIHHHFTDVAVDWAQVTAKTMPEHWRAMGTRDESMANRVIEEMRQLAKSSGKPAKCLVVMNYRHAFDLTGRRPEARRQNTYEFIKDAFGDRAANVLLNTSVLFIAPIAGGVWDGAFERSKNRPAGFDFAGSPFGEDPFDLFVFAPPIKARFRYRDVFSGFVFTHPLKDQYSEIGIPGYFAGFEPEVRRRAALVGPDYARMVDGMIREEQLGRTKMKQPLVNSRIEMLVALSMLGLTDIGLLIGLARVLVLRRTLRAAEPVLVNAA